MKEGLDYGKDKIELVSKKGRTLVAGAGRESAHATIEFIKIITDIGVDIASIITPYYFAKYMSDEKLIAYYLKIADESPIPILIYNSPFYGGEPRLPLLPLDEKQKNQVRESFAVCEEKAAF